MAMIWLFEDMGDNAAKNYRNEMRSAKWEESQIYGELFQHDKVILRKLRHGFL